MIKMILAAVVAGAFLISTPVRAEDKGTPSADKAEKGKKEKKDEKAEKGKKEGGGW